MILLCAYVVIARSQEPQIGAALLAGRRVGPLMVLQFHSTYSYEVDEGLVATTLLLRPAPIPRYRHISIHVHRINFIKATSFCSFRRGGLCRNISPTMALGNSGHSLLSFSRVAVIEVQGRALIKYWVSWGCGYCLWFLRHQRMSRSINRC